MEARTTLNLGLAVLLAFFCNLEPAFAQRGYRFTTDNFVIDAPDPTLAKKIGNLAETYRKDLSIDWLGYEIPRWRERCPITVQIAPHAGGETSFAFVTDGSGKGKPISWQMRIFGPPARILDAVLPHEITHTIFATHFGRPLPRWADEGACTTVEHRSEREKNHQMLIDFLTSKPSRGIPFNRMFVMKEYPHDILPLYAQGYSLARFLIHLKGRKQFINYIEAGLQNADQGREVRGWDKATDEFYGFQNLSELQIQWLSWVRDGSNDRPSTPPVGVANTGPAQTFTANPSANVDNRLDSSQSWYAKQSIENSPARVAANRHSLPDKESSTDSAQFSRRARKVWR